MPTFEVLTFKRCYDIEAADHDEALAIHESRHPGEIVIDSKTTAKRARGEVRDEVEGVRQVAVDGCLQSAIATLLGLEREQVPEPLHAEEDWFGIYVEQVARATGYELLSLTPEVKPRGLWVATVRVNRNGDDVLHAVVMRGAEVAWDPEWRRPLTAVAQRDIQNCMVVTPLDPRAWVQR